MLLNAEYIYQEEIVKGVHDSSVMAKIGNIAAESDSDGMLRLIQARPSGGD